MGNDIHLPFAGCPQNIMDETFQALCVPFDAPVFVSESVSAAVPVHSQEEPQGPPQTPVPP
jgi:hypothetical protein